MFFSSKIVHLLMVSALVSSCFARPTLAAATERSDLVANTIIIYRDRPNSPPKFNENNIFINFMTKSLVFQMVWQQ